MKRAGFTLVELIVVIAMLMVLTGAVSTGLMGARQRAKITKATTVCRELTNAILSYENYSKNYDLSDVATGDTWKDAEKGTLRFVLGEESSKHGASGKIAVLFNADLPGSKLVDPWGNPYKIKIVKTAEEKITDSIVRGGLQTAVAFPNFNRMREN